jgi:hypothetical protein
MNHQEWLDSLVQGDKVALRYNGWGSDGYSIREITRITPKRIIKVGVLEYNSNGKQRGLGTWDRGADLLQITQEILNHIEKSRLVKEISNTKFSELSLEKLREITELLK